MSLMGYTEQDVEYMKASVNLAYSLLPKKEKKELQNNSKISRLNQHIKAKGLAWVAGETEVSAMSYAEKKKLFGQSTFPSGIEYYVGGILTAGDGLTLKAATAKSFTRYP